MGDRAFSLFVGSKEPLADETKSLLARHLSCPCRGIQVSATDVNCLERLTCTPAENISMLLTDAVCRADFHGEVLQYLEHSRALLDIAIQQARVFKP